MDDLVLLDLLVWMDDEEVEVPPVLVVPTEWPDLLVIPHSENPVPTETPVQMVNLVYLAEQV